MVLCPPRNSRSLEKKVVVFGIFKRRKSTPYPGMPGPCLEELKQIHSRVTSPGDLQLVTMETMFEVFQHASTFVPVTRRAEFRRSNERIKIKPVIRSYGVNFRL